MGLICTISSGGNAAFIFQQQGKYLISIHTIYCFVTYQTRGVNNEA